MLRLPSLRSPICFPLLARSRQLLSKCSAPNNSFHRESFARRMALAGIKPHHDIALAVSGGPDSMALCVLTAGWKLEGLKRNGGSCGYIDGLLGIIVDHRLRSNSLEEARIVQERVLKMGIRCKIFSCNWPEGRPKIGDLQEAARNMRYQIFQDACAEEKIGVILVAHHADDQVELFILRSSRGSGVCGLAGMAFVSQLFLPHTNHSWSCSSKHGVILVRPMLEFSKYDMYQPEFDFRDPAPAQPSPAPLYFRPSPKARVIKEVYGKELPSFGHPAEIRLLWCDASSGEEPPLQPTAADPGLPAWCAPSRETSIKPPNCSSRFSLHLIFGRYRLHKME